MVGNMNKNCKASNPFDNKKSLDNLISFFKGFNKFFENEKIDEIIRQEFRREYALLPLLVKAHIYYEENN